MTAVEGEEKAARRRGRRAKNPAGEMPLGEHLKELRHRVVISVIAIALGMVVGFVVYKPVFTAMVDPLVQGSDGRLAGVNFTSVGAPFDIMLQVSAFIGVVLASPVWLYEIWAFVVPGLKKQEKKYAIGFLAASIPLFVAGLVLGWLVMPQAVQFFVSLTFPGSSILIPAETYIPFVLRLLLAFGASLVIPVLLVGLNMVGVLPAETILKHWRITVFVVALIAALAAPGSDAISMFYLAAPLLVLFAVGILVCVLNDRRRARPSSRPPRPIV